MSTQTRMEHSQVAEVRRHAREAHGISFSAEERSRFSCAARSSSTRVGGPTSVAEDTTNGKEQ